MHNQARFLSWILAALTLTAAAAPAGGPDRLLDFTSQTHQEVLAESKGKVVLFNFWATWCAPCREEMPQLVEMEVKLRSQGFRLVTVSADETEDKAAALKFAQECRVPSPAYIKNVSDDDAFINTLDPNWSGALPALFLYDKQGQRRKAFIGETKIADLEKQILPLL